MTPSTPMPDTMKGREKKVDLPTFLELAEHQLSYAGRKDKIITIKVCVNTARMMVEAERAAMESTQ